MVEGRPADDGALHVRMYVRMLRTAVLSICQNSPKFCATGNYLEAAVFFFFFATLVCTTTEPSVLSAAYDRPEFDCGREVLNH